MKKNTARLIPRGTDESRRVVERVQLVMDLTSQLNVLRHSDVDGRNALLNEIGPCPHVVDTGFVVTRLLAA